jgi:ArsR family transcriptional regulator, arsenate/arsenite/antimonite-responsive transcriptional repressor / arsenate reductase (thioredoxin)
LVVVSGMRYAEQSPPQFLRLAANPLRWELLAELSHSDRRVGELCSLSGRKQSLVSYHIARLRVAGLVTRRRSSADGRDSYYVLDLARCREMIGASGQALHPGLQLSPPAVDRERRLQQPRRNAATRLLFLCTGNSARSQMAEALVEELAGGSVEARSAGSHPKPLHPNAVCAMREHGIDLRGRRSKHLSEFSEESFDYVVSLCDRVREVCPEFPGHPDAIHWSIPDPSREGGDDDQSYPAFQRTAAELATRVPFLLDLIAYTRSTSE